MTDAIGEDRRKCVVHTTRNIIRQRMYDLLLGHEDLNDHGRLWLDPALQANRRFVTGKLRFPQLAVMRDGAMASPSTLCCFERNSTPAEALAPNAVLFSTSPSRRIRLRPGASHLTSTPMTSRCTRYRKAGSTTATTEPTAACRFTSSATDNAGSGAAAERLGRGFGAVAGLNLLAQTLRAEWPGVEVILRGDRGTQSFPLTNLRFEYRFCHPCVPHARSNSGVGYSSACRPTSP